MHTVEIPLLNFKVRFRSLTWREEFALKPGAKEDPTLHFLAHAMVGVVGMTPLKSPQDALAILKVLPPAIRKRVWLIYRGSLPEMRHFTTRGLYQAPDPTAYNHKVRIEEDDRDVQAEAATRQVESRFGVQEMQETQALGQRFLADAQRRGALTPATPDVEGSL